MRIRAFAALLTGLLSVAAVHSSAFAADDAKAAAVPAPSAACSDGASLDRFMLPILNRIDDKAAASGKAGFVSPTKSWGPYGWAARGASGTNKKLVVVSFFASWCRPCRAEIPELARLYKKYADQGLGVISVSVDQGNEQRDELVKIANDNGITYPVIHDRFGIVGRRCGVESLPHMLLVGNDGKVKKVHLGYTDEVKNGLEKEILQMLGLPAEIPADTAPKSSEQAPSVEPKSDGKKAG